MIAGSDKKSKINIWLYVSLLALVIFFAIIPFFIAKDGDFEGADVKAEQAVAEINPDYEPWFSPLFEPKSGEIESLLFALQAAIGSGFIGYYLGRMNFLSKRQVNK